MESVNHIVVDVSSDEEADKRVDGFDWLGKKPKIIGYRKSNSSDGDDDCVVLDGDPYKTMANEKETDTCENDEVLVVGQKGEIACRDFPHPRHDCAEYPFNSASHDKYCEMCHCYVCDKRAPCPFWGVGTSSFDHCHANDKEEVWIVQRECLRTGKIPPRPVTTKTKLQRPSSALTQPRPVSTKTQLQRPCSPLTLVGNGIRGCSTTRVATHPSTYTRPGYRTKQSKAFPQNPGLQARVAQLVSSNPPTFTQRPIRGVYPPPPPQYNPQGSQCPTPLNPYAPPFNPQRIFPGYIPAVPESQSKVYARRFNQNMYSSNVQTSTVPSKSLFPPPPQYQQQQQPGRSIDKRLAEFEDWLMMDNPTVTVSDFPLSGQDTAGTIPSDFEAFIEGLKR